MLIKTLNAMKYILITLVFYMLPFAVKAQQNRCFQKIIYPATSYARGTSVECAFFFKDILYKLKFIRRNTDVDRHIVIKDDYGRLVVDNFINGQYIYSFEFKTKRSKAYCILIYGNNPDREVSQIYITGYQTDEKH